MNLAASTALPLSSWLAPDQPPHPAMTAASTKAIATNLIAEVSPAPLARVAPARLGAGEYRATSRWRASRRRRRPSQDAAEAEAWDLRERSPSPRRPAPRA